MWKMLFFNICLICSTILINVNANDESPGFFLKVSKNVPRLGRRSTSDSSTFFLKSSKSIPRIGRRNNDQSNGDGIMENPPTWYDIFMNPSKRMMGNYRDNLILEQQQQSAYRKVQPFDSNFLLDIALNDQVNSNDFKFVSWQDFDVALESDTQLYSKLEALAKAEEELTNEINVQHFVPMSDLGNNNRGNGGGGGGGGNSRYRSGGNNGLFYRTERELSSLNKNSKFIDRDDEKINYQM